MLDYKIDTNRRASYVRRDAMLEYLIYVLMKLCVDKVKVTRICKMSSGER